MLVEQGGRGGVADYTNELSRALADEGVPLVLATARDHLYGEIRGVDVFTPFYYFRGGSVVRDGVRRVRGHRLVNALAFLAAVPRVVTRSRRCEVVHLQGGHLPPLFLALVLALRVSGATIVHTPHNTFDRGRSWRRVRELTARNVSRVIVHAESDLANLPRSVRSRARVIPHGLYAGLARRAGGSMDRAEARRVLGIDGDDMVALVFGQIRPDKGIDDVLSAAAKVSGLTIVIAGEDRGALDDCVELMARPELRDRVLVFEGFHAVDRIPLFFSAADVVVLAYRVASQSGVLMLAYAFARPVVAYPVGGLAEAVEDGRTGWVTQRADADALFDTLADVVAAGAEECRRRGNEAALLASERYAWESIARSTIGTYEAALACRA
jgi:glycosyltransferase involved in cell wall biosynthesis